MCDVDATCKESVAEWSLHVAAITQTWKCYIVHRFISPLSNAATPIQSLHVGAPGHRTDENNGVGHIGYFPDRNVLQDVCSSLQFKLIFVARPKRETIQLMCTGWNQCSIIGDVYVNRGGHKDEGQLIDTTAHFGMLTQIPQLVSVRVFRWWKFYVDPLW